MNKLTEIVLELAATAAVVLASGPALSMPQPQQPANDTLASKIANVLTEDNGYSNFGPFRAGSQQAFNDNKKLTADDAELLNIQYEILRDKGLSPEGALALTVYSQIFTAKEMKTRLQDDHYNDPIARSLRNLTSEVTGKKWRAEVFNADLYGPEATQILTTVALQQAIAKTPAFDRLQQQLTAPIDYHGFRDDQLATIAETLSTALPTRSTTKADMNDRIEAVLEDQTIRQNIADYESERSKDQNFYPSIYRGAIVSRQSPTIMM